jgi:predicted  nucleic acid-binding Zn-ribbon protein
MENARERKFSRTVLLNYLGENCGEIYKPQSLEELNIKIDNYMKEKEQLEKELREIEKREQNDPQLKIEKKKEIEGVKKNIHQTIVDFLQEKNIK